ncbi:MAG: tRNA dihydrouridine synthase DusB [Clostridia bacterium]|nr:tRNA dihydrouridine synthase DusB [Clostridia bacterium]
MVKIDHIEVGEFPILLAPMEDVSDPPFRYVCKMMGADIMYTEFISSEGLIRDAAKSVKKLDFTEFERPIGIQIFGHNIESMIKAAQYAEQANPDIIDINYGCPVRKVVAKGAGSGILNDIPKMVKMTEAVVKATKLPVTVKTRLGYDNEHKEIVDIAERLQDVGIKALTIHGRTRTMRPREKAEWELIGEVKKNQRMHIPIFGNGDVFGAQSAKYFKDNFGVDGLMVARGSYGNPWIFKEIKHYLNTGELLEKPNIKERIQICKIHFKKSVEWKGERTGLLEMRKHYSDYFKGYVNFKPYRMQLVHLESYEEILKVLDEVEKVYAED